MDDKQKNDWQEREIGALWKKESSNGSYYSGKLKIGNDNYEVVCFPNKHKSEDKHPDIRVYKSEPRQQ